MARLVSKDDSKDPEALALHATLLLASSDPRQAKAAVAELQPLITRMPRNATLHFNLGRAYMGLNNPDKAREQLEAALRLDPHYAPAKLAWAELALERGEPAGAVQATGEVLSEDPTNLAARLIRARAFVNIGETLLAKAREELGTALRMEPAAKDGRAQLAELDFRQHRYQEAEEGFRALLQTNDSRGVAGFLKTQIAQGQFERAVQFASDQ